MGPLTAIVFLAALLHQSVGQVSLNLQYPFFRHTEAQNRQLIIEQHNEIRRSVVPPASNMLKMVWSEKAAASARRWAHKCQMKASPPKERLLNGVPCGENILMSTYPSTWPEAIKQWYNQMANFKYGIGPVRKNANFHSYTQLVWYSSYEVGCAVAYCPKSQFNYFYVCHYSPAGNNPLQITTPYKKGPRCSDCLGHCDRGLCTNPCRHQDVVSNCANLKSLFGCENPMVKTKCPATCRCINEIR